MQKRSVCIAARLNSILFQIIIEHIVVKFSYTSVALKCLKNVEFIYLFKNKSCICSHKQNPEMVIQDVSFDSKIFLTCPPPTPPPTHTNRNTIYCELQWAQECAVTFLWVSNITPHQGVSAAGEEQD